MSHAPHPFQPVLPAQAMNAPAFNPRQAIRNPYPGQVPHYPGHAAPGPSHMGAPAGVAYPATPQHGYPPQAGPVPSPYGMTPAGAYPAAPSMIQRPGIAPVAPLSKKEAKRAAKAQKAQSKAQAKTQARAQKQATRQRSPLIPFLLGMLVGGILTVYLSSSLFAPRQLDGPAWTLPSSSDVPLAEAIPEEDVLFDEADG